MSNFPASATQLKYVKDGSSWSSDGAMQGRYGTQTPRTGVMLFPTIRNVDWVNQNITEIKLKLTFANVGTRAKKTISLYQGAKNTITGTGADMRGDAIGSYTTSSYAYNGSDTTTFTETLNTTAFAGFVNWLKNGSSKTLVMYRWESSDGAWSPNYLRVTAASLTITYELAGSGGTLNVQEFEAGSDDTVSLTITPMETEPGEALTHSVKWSLGDYTVTQSIAVGETTASYTVPLEWLNAMPDTARGAAACTLTTFVDGVERGTRIMEFAVTVPATAAPTFTAVSAHVNVNDGEISGYYQRIGKAVLTIDGAAGQYGADIASCSISGEGESTTGFSLTTAAFKRAGTHTYTLTVTDTRGLSTSQEITFEVLPTAAPQIGLFDAQRYAVVVDETTQYVAADYGNYVWFNAEAVADPADGNNAIEAYILYSKAGEEEKARVSLTVNADGTLSLANARDIITAEIDTNSAYVFELHVQDLASRASSADSVAKGRCNVHYAGSGYGACFGGFAKGTEANPMLESWYPLYAYNGIHGVNRYEVGEVETGGVWIDGKKIYRNVFTGIALAGTSVNIDMIESLETVIGLQGMIAMGDTGTRVPLLYSYNGDDVVAGVRSDGTVYVNSYKGGAVFVIVDYTKYTPDEFGIIVQPMDIQAVGGDTVTFEVVAVGAVSYQWQVGGTDGASWTDLTWTGANTASMTHTMNDTNIKYVYRCKLTGHNGAVLYTNTIRII